MSIFDNILLDMKAINILRSCRCYDEKSTCVETSEESGLDRIKRMYKADKYGMLSPEMHYFIQSTNAVIVISAVMGAATQMLKVKNDYFRQNTATTFESEYRAKRHLTDSMTLGGIKGGLKYVVKYGSFSSLYILSTMTLANYSNDISLLHHVGTGAMLGAMFRINYGLKGMTAAAGLGGFLGMFSGGFILLFMRFHKMTFNDLRKWQQDEYYYLKKQETRWQD